jgi:hypothetical protein
MCAGKSPPRNGGFQFGALRDAGRAGDNFSKEAQMPVPRFTAEASLYKTKRHYHQYLAGSGVGAGAAAPPEIRAQACLPIGAGCTLPGDCCSNWCNESNQCDCFDIGDDCYFGGQSCCSGACGLDGTCVPAPTISAYWLNSGDGKGFVLVTGQNFTHNTSAHPVNVKVDLPSCNGGGGGSAIAPTDINGSFTAWTPCGCGPTTLVWASDNFGMSAVGSPLPLPC